MSVPQRILGIDFTSAPSRKKPLTCAQANFDGSVLVVEELLCWSSFADFEAALQAAGPWVAAIDFPFGQPRRLIENIGWPLSWSGYVEHVAAMSKDEFRLALNDYKAPRATGDKHHKRICDVIAGSQSPQTLNYTPVGLMFFEGAPRLLQAGVHLPHFYNGDTDRVVLEGYPGLVARSLIGRTSYKNDNPAKQSEAHARARKMLLTELLSGRCADIYGFTLRAPIRYADDPTGDELDAVLCAIQAAWGWCHRDRGYGAPAVYDRLEGWICDPAVLKPTA